MRLVLPLPPVEAPCPPARPVASGGLASPRQGSASAFQPPSPRLPEVLLNSARYLWQENENGLTCRLVDRPTRLVGSVVYNLGWWRWLCIAVYDYDRIGEGRSYFQHEAQLKVEEAYDANMAIEAEKVLGREDF